MCHFPGRRSIGRIPSHHGVRVVGVAVKQLHGRRRGSGLGEAEAVFVHQHGLRGVGGEAVHADVLRRGGHGGRDVDLAAALQQLPACGHRGGPVGHHIAGFVHLDELDRYGAARDDGAVAVQEGVGVEVHERALRAKHRGVPTRLHGKGLRRIPKSGKQLVEAGLRYRRCGGTALLAGRH